MNTDTKILKQMLTNQIQQHVGRITCKDQVGSALESGKQGWLDKRAACGRDTRIHRIRRPQDPSSCGDRDWPSWKCFQDKNTQQTRASGTMCVFSPHSQASNYLPGGSTMPHRWRAPPYETVLLPPADASPRCHLCFRQLAADGGYIRLPPWVWLIC